MGDAATGRRLAGWSEAYAGFGSCSNIGARADALVREVVARISLLEKNDPPTAERLRSVILNWNGTAVNALLLKDLRDGKSSADAVLKLLTVRKELREKQSAEVADIRSGNPTAVGIAACLLDNEADYSAVFGGENTEAKAALFACRRLIRAKIPIPKPRNICRTAINVLPKQPSFISKAKTRRKLVR